MKTSYEHMNIGSSDMDRCVPVSIMLAESECHEQMNVEMLNHQSCLHASIVLVSLANLNYPK